MAMSGVTVADEVIKTFEELKRKKAFRYIVFTIADGKTISNAAIGERTATYDDFLTKLPKDNAAYGIFDVEYETPDGPREKIVLIAWIPDTAKPRERMLYSSSKQALDNLDSSLLHIQANDQSDVAFETVVAKIKANKSA